MKRGEMLKKTIQKALKNGWKSPYTQGFEQMAEFMAEDGSWTMILFNKEFAKAFWGEEPFYLVEMETGGYEDDDFYLEWKQKVESEATEEWEDGIRDEMPAWQYHLQQAVLADDVIKYYYDQT